MAESRDINADDAQTAARISEDVGVEHIADVYAKALLGAAENAGKTTEVLDEFDSLVADVLAASPKFEEVLASALVSADEKAGILDRVLGQQASPLLLNFLKVVARHGRLNCLRPIHRRAQFQFDQMRERVRVTLTTAAPVDKQLANRLARGLSSAFGGEPVVETRTDPQLIGGAVIRVGDTVYDGSIANQLQNIREQMIDRSAHEIQSRRDRFRNPAGN